jgi:hypothetical protein
MHIRTSWASALALVAPAGFGFVAVGAAGGGPPNTGMADPAALVTAFDRFAGSGTSANILTVSLSNLRGVSTEAVNAGGSVAVNLATCAVASVVWLLPPDATFDLRFIDNSPGPGHDTLAQHRASHPPTDALFVAETNPALAALDKSDLVRRFGLILVNADGFDASRGVAIDSTVATLRPRMPRVRAEDPLLSAAISQGVERSSTFRRLLEAIDATDGLVYVTEGTCGQGVQACLHMSIELAGANRLLRILVNPRRAAGCELFASIGHELQHALEALSNPNIKTSFALFSFFHQIGREDSQRFETGGAKQSELSVAKEVCRKAVPLTRPHSGQLTRRNKSVHLCLLKTSYTLRSLLALFSRSLPRIGAPGDHRAPTPARHAESIPPSASSFDLSRRHGPFFPANRVSRIDS